MVVAGIVFLLLPIAGQLAGRITVPPEQRRQATVIGCLLVVVGVALHVVPPMLNPPKLPDAPSQTTPPPAIKPDQPSQTPAPQPRIEPPPPPPKTQDFQVVPLPLLNARLTALRFFEANPCDIPPLGQRAYKQYFTRKFARDIFTEFTLEHPKREQRLDFNVHAFYRHEGKVIGEPASETYIRADQLGSVYWFHRDQGRQVLLPCSGKTLFWGHNWEVGSYTVEIYINRERVTSHSFEIQE